MRRNLLKKTSELEVLQWNKFKILLEHAYGKVSFYRDLLNSAGTRPEDIKSYDDIHKIPTITKLQLRNNRKDIIAKNINLESCVEYKTSGSTGNTLSGYLTKDDALYVRGSYERVRNENGFRMFQDSLLIMGGPHTIPSPNDKTWYQYFGIRRIEGLNIFEPLDIQIMILKKAKPDALWGFPSAIKLLAKAIEEEKISGISPRLIFTNAEVLDFETRNFINSVFNNQIVDVYGSWETCCMAWECSEHAGYHINMDTALVEVIDENGRKVKAGQKGKVVVTNLHSFAMPIIRYEIGDFAVPTYKECPCGRGGYLLKTIEGRYDDFIKLRGNKVISPPVFWSIMKSIPEVSQFQIVQEALDKVAVYVVKIKEFIDINLLEQIEKEFKNILGKDVFLDIRVVEKIPRAQSGKLRSVISKV